MQCEAKHHGWDTFRTIHETNADTIVEVTPTNLKSGDTGTAHCMAALESQNHVVTTIKGPVALAYRKFMDLARYNGVEFRFEGTLMSGTPLIEVAKRSLAGAKIRSIRGSLNGTMNFILSEMERRKTYEKKH